MEGKIKNRHSQGKNSYFNLNSNSDAPYESVSQTDIAPTFTTSPWANDWNSIKKHISAFNTEITALRSFILEQMVFFF